MPRASGAPVLLLARADAPEVPLQADPQAAPRVDGARGPGRRLRPPRRARRLQHPGAQFNSFVEISTEFSTEFL